MGRLMRGASVTGRWPMDTDTFRELHRLCDQVLLGMVGDDGQTVVEGAEAVRTVSTAFYRLELEDGEPVPVRCTVERAQLVVVYAERLVDAS